MNKKLLTLSQIPLIIPNNIQKMINDLINNNETFVDDEEILRQIFIALITGHHIILYGPVGTGKTELARKIAKIFDVDLVTATVGEDWDSSEYLLGWEELVKGSFRFAEGYLLKALQKAFNNIEAETTKTLELKKQKQSCWLLLDEMNRGDINKYLSSLITSLEPIKDNLKEKDFIEKYKISIKTPSGIVDVPIPKRFRIIGTINTFDKNLLYKFPSAIKGRRFTFIPIGIPRNYKRERKIIFSIVKQEYNVSQWKDIIIMGKLIYYIQEIIINLRNRKFEIGTSIFLDIVRYVYTAYIFYPKENLYRFIDSSISVKIIPMIQDISYDIQDSILEYFDSYKNRLPISNQAIKTLILSGNIFND